MRKFFLQMAPQGSLVKMKSTGGVMAGGGLRGVVSGFSNSSRSRMLQAVARLQRGALPLFVTLTYPADFPTSREVYKYHLRRFFDDLAYRFPRYGAIWKLEFQKRGAAHYHLMIWGISIEHAQLLIPRLWCRVVGSQDENHLAWHRGELGEGNENCVQAIRSWGGVVSYASKYLSKMPETQEETGELITGRIWGVRGAVPFSKLYDMRLDTHAALEFRKMMFERLGLKEAEHGLGFWSFGFHPDLILWLDWMYGGPNPPPADPLDEVDFYGLESSFIF